MIHITIAGELGSGKSTVSNYLRDKIDYKIVSAGLIFRELAKKFNMSAKEFNQFIESDPHYDHYVDDTIKALGEKDDASIFDSRMAWYFVPNSFKIFMYVDVDTATDRIFNDKGRVSESYPDIATARQDIIERRKSEVLRYSNFYHVDVNNFKNYDFIIDTSYAQKESINELVLNSFNAYRENSPYIKIWLSPKSLLFTKDIKDHSVDEDLVMRLKKNGYGETPPVEVLKYDNKFYVYDGHERVRGAAAAGIKLVPVKKLYEGNDVLPDGERIGEFMVSHCLGVE